MAEMGARSGRSLLRPLAVVRTGIGVLIVGQLV